MLETILRANMEASFINRLLRSLESWVWWELKYEDLMKMSVLEKKIFLEKWGEKTNKNLSTEFWENVEKLQIRCTPFSIGVDFVEK